MSDADSNQEWMLRRPSEPARVIGRVPCAQINFDDTAFTRPLPVYCAVDLDKLRIRPLCVPLLEVF